MSNQEKEILEENTVTEETVEIAEEATDAGAEETVETEAAETEKVEEDAAQEKDNNLNVLSRKKYNVSSYK